MAPPSPQDTTSFYLGIMSGTSLDGIDCVVAKIDSSGKSQLIVHYGLPYSDALRRDFSLLQKESPNELHLEALCANQLAIAYADAAKETLRIAGLTSEQITAIGAHGQTIRHQPTKQPDTSYTRQCLNAALLAELTQIHVICDFRSRDMAALGQGAPLVPGFHAAQFSSSQAKAVLNLGGIANLSLLRPESPILGFDTGPANVLLNDWTEKQLSQAFDEDGQWARSGSIHNELLKSLLSDPYFSAPIPKSTGRDYFHLRWLEKCFPTLVDLKHEDIQATLVELTARSIAQQLNAHLPGCSELIVCGGGVANQYLMERISKSCQELLPTMKICSSNDYGIHPQTVEGMAFAWLAWSFMNQLPGNIPSVTGAKAPRILGAFYPK